eukprot:3162938-Rhodomonas_salina.2
MLINASLLAGRETHQAYLLCAAARNEAMHSQRTFRALREGDAHSAVVLPDLCRRLLGVDASVQSLTGCCEVALARCRSCLLYTSPSPRDRG